MDKLQKSLFEMQNIGYKSFHSKLMPTVSPDSIIGIPTPVLRKFAKEYSKTSESAEFLKNLPHRYYEENNLHAFLIQQIKDLENALDKTNTFLPYINNWATCDMFTPKVFKTNKPKILHEAYKWMESDHTYTVRYGIKILMDLFLDDDFSEEQMLKIATIKKDDYYIRMMVAWYFATALAKQYKYAIKILENNTLTIWTHNKTIQKAIESRRIDPATKQHLKTLKRKPEAIK